MGELNQKEYEENRTAEVFKIAERRMAKSPGKSLD
jgi:hypothetical protein